MPHTYQYPAHYVSVNPVIFGANSDSEPCTLKLLLVERGVKGEPFRGMWALPGGFVGPKESVDAAAARELEEETGIAKAYLEQLYTFGEPDRDPRGRVITVAYMGLVDRGACRLQAGTDAARAQWFDVDKLPPLAFDHAHIVALALQRLRTKVRYEPIAFHLLPSPFTVAQLHALYETLFERELEMPNFRRSLVKMDLLKAVGEETDVSHRPAKLFRYDEKAYARLLRGGGSFWI